MEQQITPSQNTAEAQHIFFVGREYEQQMYASFLTQDTRWLLLITGLPGSGKSALLTRLKDQTEKQNIPVILLNFARPWLRTDILTVLEKLAAQLQPYSDTSQFQQELERSHQSFSESDKKISRIVIEAEQADREQLQWISQARDAYRGNERAVEDAVKAFYHLVETPRLERLVIMLDTSEWLYEPRDMDVGRVGKWIMNRFLPGLRQHMRRQGKCCHVVLTSREHFSLEKVREQEREEYTLPPLDQAAVEEYLWQKGMKDKAQREQVYKMSRGHPFSMILIAELWEMRKDQPLLPADFLYEQEELNIPALLDYLRGWLLDKQPTDLFVSFIRYGVLLRNFDLPMLQEVFREFLGEVQEQAQFNRLTSAPYILPRDGLYAFHDLMHEMLAPYIRIHERDKWQMYHERAWKYLSKLATHHGTAYPVDGYYHALAFNEKKGLEEWRRAVKKAYKDGKREVLAALFLVAYDKTLELSPRTRAAIAYEQGRYYYTDQQWDEALKNTRRALYLYKKAGDVAGQARACVGIASVQRFRPDRNLQAALIYYKRAYDLYLSLDDGGADCYLNQARRLYEIGEVLRFQKKPDKALESYSKALAIFQAFGYYRDMAYVHRSMGEALAQPSLDQKKDAIKHYKQALALLPGEGDPAGRAEMSKALGDLQQACQNWTEAAQAYEQGLSFYQQDSDQQASDLVGQALMYQSLGSVEKILGQEGTALISYQRALNLYAQREKQPRSRSKKRADYVKTQSSKADIYWAINEILQNLHDYEGAVHNCVLAIALCQESGDEMKVRQISATIDRIRRTQTKWTTILYESDRETDKVLADILSNCEKRGDRLGAAYTCQSIAEHLWGHGEELKLVLEAYHSARWYYGQVSDVRGQAYASQKIAEVERNLGNLQTALEVYGEAYDYYGQVSDDWGQAYASQQIAEIERDLGHLQNALKAYQDARWYYGKVSDKPGMAYVSQRMGETEQLRGDSKQALCFFDNAHSYYSQIGDRAGEAYVQEAMGKIKQEQNAWPEARKYYRDALYLYQYLSNRMGEACLYMAWGVAEQAAAQWLKALEYFEKALKLYLEWGDRLAAAFLYYLIGDVQQSQQQWEKAEESYNQALRCYGQEKTTEHARIYRAKGDMHRKNGKLDAALNDYWQAAPLYETLKDFAGAASVYKAIAEIQAIVEIRNTRRQPEADQEITKKTVVLEGIAGDQQTSALSPLKVDAHVELEQDGHAFVNRMYTLRVSLVQEQVEAILGRKIVIGIDLDIDGPVTYQKQRKQLCYNPPETQWVDFPFELKAKGPYTLNVKTFYNTRWLGTIPLTLNAIEPSPTDQTPTLGNRAGKQLVQPLDDNFPVAVCLLIGMRGDTYTVQISCDRGVSKCFDMKMNKQSLSNLCTRLQRAIECVSSAAVGEEDLEKALYNLRVQGNSAWETIFSDKSAQDMIQQALKDRAIIQVVADPDQFNLPWELVYHDDPIEIHKKDVPGFWGMRYHIIRSLPYEGEWPPKSIQAITPTVGFIRDKNLAAAEREWKELKAWTTIHCMLLRDLDEGKHGDEFRYLTREFLRNQKLHILHFACDIAEENSNWYLRVSDNFYIKREEFDSKFGKFEMPHHPLVILNACNTGIVDPLRTSNWVTLFWERGACGIVATEARVLDEFAAKFSKKIYELLLMDKRISEVLLEARNYFWEKDHDPSGLAYALYASPNLKIEIQKSLKEEL